MKLEPLPDYGDLIELNQWLEMIETDFLIDYDGYGYWATKDGMKGKVYPSDIVKGIIPPKWATHVIWFNR